MIFKNIIKIKIMCDSFLCLPVTRGISSTLHPWSAPSAIRMIATASWSVDIVFANPV